MGYVQPTSLMKKLGSKDINESRAAAKEMLEGYNRYKQEMKKGIWGGLFSLSCSLGKIKRK